MLIIGKLKTSSPFPFQWNRPMPSSSKLGRMWKCSRASLVKTHIIWMLWQKELTESSNPGGFTTAFKSEWFLAVTFVVHLIWQECNRCKFRPNEKVYPGDRIEFNLSFKISFLSGHRDKVLLSRVYFIPVAGLNSTLFWEINFTPVTGWNHY